MATLTRTGDVFELHLGDSENRFNPESIASINDALDTVEAAAEPRALVTTAVGKIWSNGLDLDWMLGHPAEAAQFIDAFHALLGRALVLPVPCVAALQGHTFAGGAMLALAHDVRVMRADRGYLCLPEVDIRIPFTAGMGRLIQAKLTKAAAHRAMTTGHRYGGEEAAGAGIVDAAVPEAQVLPAAVAAAQSLAGKDGATLGAIKRQMYADVLTALSLPGVSALADLAP